MVRRRVPLSPLLFLLPSSVLGYSNAGVAPAAADASQAVVAPFVVPAVHYNSALSFRGVLDGGKVEGFDISGHATGLPGVHDYLRLVPANPLAHGALFSQKPMESEEWIAEIAFRVHGPPAVGLVDVSEDDDVPAKSIKVHKGGRGLAFWVSKSGAPGPVTISADPKATLANPPPSLPSMPDPTDPSVSLFGYKTSFDGLGVIFDTSPTAPVFSRSDAHNFGLGGEGAGVGSSGVVSGIMDDGTGEWLEPKGRKMKDDDEAAYLDKAIGECEAAFRNAQGLLWARISYVNQTIRVDLDLAPHTTLAKAGRDYAHNCFALDGIKIPTGAHFGLTGIASGNAEPDSVDVYAMDVFEVIKIKDDGSTIVPPTDEPVEDRTKHPLEGTSDDAITSLAHEIFLSQARMVEAIDALARRVEYLSRSVGSGRVPPAGQVTGPGSSNTHLMNRLKDIETRLDEVAHNTARPGSPSHAEAAKGTHEQAAAAAKQEDQDTITHILQLQDRLMVELKAFGRKLDTATGQSIGSLATLSSRSAESLQLLQRAVSSLDEAAAGRLGWVWYGLGLVGVGGYVMWSRGRRDGGYGKKMI
ncbi:hypothetical protein RQP46_007594 [Phenoliferia psychrophenolica]